MGAAVRAVAMTGQLRWDVRRLRALALWLAWLPGIACAQGDPILDAAAEQDPDAVLAWTGDASLSFDHVDGLPDGRSVERFRARLRFGLLGQRGAVEYALAAIAGAGSDSNADNRRNNDNQRSNGVGLDQVWLRWSAGEHTTLLLGKAPLPMQLTPLVWDHDLRPVGASLERRWPIGDFDSLRLLVGHFAGDHLYGDRSRINAAQLGFHYREGAPFSADVQLALLDFDRLERLAGEGLARTNRRVGTRLVSDYRLLDLQFGLNWELARAPLALRLDLLRNLGADDLDRGGRASLVYGHADARGGLELGFAAQRIQRDAAMAAFNSDDWWFHSAAKGVMPWVAWGFDNGWALQASGFREQLDGRNDHVHRLLFELRGPLP